jgi:hypothetical protein
VLSGAPTAPGSKKRRCRIDARRDAAAPSVASTAHSSSVITSALSERSGAARRPAP